MLEVATSESIRAFYGVNMSKRKVEQKKPDFKGFVNCELNAARKEMFKTWAPGITELDSAILECLSPGYKLSFSIDTYHDAIQASWYCSAMGDRNAGWCLTARASTITKALLVLLFKHTILLEGDWTSVDPADEGSDGIG